MRRTEAEWQLKLFRFCCCIVSKYIVALVFDFILFYSTTSLKSMHACHAALRLPARPLVTHLLMLQQNLLLACRYVNCVTLSQILQQRVLNLASIIVSSKFRDGTWRNFLKSATRYAYIEWFIFYCFFNTFLECMIDKWNWCNLLNELNFSLYLILS